MLFDKDEIYTGFEGGSSSILETPSSGIGMSAGGAAPVEPPSGSGLIEKPRQAPRGGPNVARSMLGMVFPPYAKFMAGKGEEREKSVRAMTAGISAMKEGLDMLSGLEGEQRSAFVDKYKVQLDKFEGGLGSAFETLAANPETAGAINEWAHESDTLKLALKTGGLKSVKKLLEKDGALKTILGEIDSKRMPVLLRKGQTFMVGWQQLVTPEMAEQFNKDGRISASELITANEWIKAHKPDVAKTLAFTDAELAVIGRNSDAFYHSLGIVSPKDEGQLLVDKAKGENKAKPAPDRTIKKTVNGKVMDQLQEWDGTKWVDKGEATPHHKPDAPGDVSKPVMDMELKVGDDYARDSKKFSERRPLFDSATDYYAKRGAKGENKTSAGDAALMFAYAKMRDPNDRLAVSETRDLVKLGNIFERFGVSVQGILDKGETLPDRVAKEMYDEIRRSFTEQNRQQARIEKQYRDKVKSYGGNPDRVVTGYSISDDELNPKKNDGETRKTVNGKNYIKVGGKWYEE